MARIPNLKLRRRTKSSNRR